MTKALLCPRCRIELTPRLVPNGSAWWCSRCNGASFNLALLGAQVDVAAVTELWNLANATSAEPRLSCPSCDGTLSGFSSSGVDLEICRTCQLIWLDPGETEEIGARLEPDLPYEARRAVALAESEVLGEAASIQKRIAEIRRLLAVHYWYLGERD